MAKVVPVQPHLGLIKLLAESMPYRAKGHRSTITLTLNFEVWAEVMFTGIFFILGYFFRSAFSLF